MTSYDEQKRMVAEAAAQFPGEFALRAFPLDKFRVNVFHSYVAERVYNGQRTEEVKLYLDIWRRGEWMAFDKGTVEELKREVVR